MRRCKYAAAGGKETYTVRKAGRVKKNCCLFLAVVFYTLLLAGCTKKQQNGQNEKASDAKQEQLTAAGQEQAQETEQKTVELTVWGAQEDAALMEQVLDSFQEEYFGQADFQITYEPQGESTCKDVLLGGLEEGADVFAFADDQLSTLAAAGALVPVENADTVRADNLDKAVEAASLDGTPYAYPLTADNGYFLYYNKAFFTEEDVKSLDTILKIAADNGKLFTMDWTSGWYVYAFFGGTGLEVGLNDDGITNYCTWNGMDGEIKGVDTAQAMLDIAASPGFSSKTDTEFLEGVQNGTVIAGVSGVWNDSAIKEAWGENLGAAKLPEYTCGGKQIQMASFSGCKLVGVNAYSKHPKWAEKLAEWITNEKNQELRFAMRGQGPSNSRAAQSSQVQASPSIAALLEQSEFSQLQRIGGKYWDPVSAFGQNMAAGNPQGLDLQEQLDKMVEGISER